MSAIYYSRRALCARSRQCGIIPPANPAVCATRLSAVEIADVGGTLDARLNSIDVAPRIEFTARCTTGVSLLFSGTIATEEVVAGPNPTFSVEIIVENRANPTLSYTSQPVLVTCPSATGAPINLGLALDLALPAASYAAWIRVTLFSYDTAIAFSLAGTFSMTRGSSS